MKDLIFSVKQQHDGCKIFQTAMQDWPNHVDTASQYIVEIEKLINDGVSKKEIEKFLNNVDYNKNAWEAESLSQLIELYAIFDSNITLREIERNLNCKNIQE